jgi:hypothetical protein
LSYCITRNKVQWVDVSFKLVDIYNFLCHIQIAIYHIQIVMLHFLVLGFEVNVATYSLIFFAELAQKIFV